MSHYDPDEELRECLARPVNEGAVTVPLHTIPALAAMIAAEPRCSVVISDVHGWHDRLLELLQGLGLVGAGGERLPGSTTLVQIGDGIDGRRGPGDLRTLGLILRVFDRYLLGNHEAAYLRGGPGFDGRPASVGLALAIEEAAAAGRLTVAHAEADVLFTHAGVHPGLLGLRRTTGAAARLERLLAEWLVRRGRRPTPIFAIEARRGGASRYGGVLWQSWRALLAAPRAPYRQVVGHSPLGRVEADPEGRVHCFDTGGSRLGVAVCWPDGRLVFGSDVIPRSQAA